MYVRSAPLSDAFDPVEAAPQVPVIGPSSDEFSTDVPTIQIVGNLTCEQLNAERAQYYAEQGLGPAPQDDCNATKKVAYTWLLWGAVAVLGLLVISQTEQR